MSAQNQKDLPPSSRLGLIRGAHELALLNQTAKMASHDSQDARPTRVHQLQHAFSPLAAAAFVLEVQRSEQTPDHVASNALRIGGLCAYYERAGMEILVSDEDAPRRKIPVRAAFISDDLNEADRRQATPGIARVRDAARAAVDFVVMEGLPNLRRASDENGAFFAINPENPLHLSEEAAAALAFQRAVDESLLHYDPAPFIDDAFSAYVALAAQERAGHRLLVHDPEEHTGLYVPIVGAPQR